MKEGTMLFGQKPQLFSVNEIINSILQSGEIKGRSGSVVIERKEGRKTINNATLYFRNEAIYAAEIKENPIPIALRIWTGKQVDEKALETIVQSCGSNSSPDITRQVLNKQLANESTMENYIKEHFLENISDIFSWENCKGKWNLDQTTRDFVMPNASVSKLRLVVNSRAAKYTEFTKLLAPFFKASEVQELVFFRQGNTENNFSAEINAIISLANGENTVTDIANKTGIGRTNILQTLISLWEKDMIHIKYGAIELSYESAMAAHKKDEEKVLLPTYEAEAVELQSEPVVEEAIDTNAPHEREQVFDESLMSDDQTDITSIEEKELDNTENVGIIQSTTGEQDEKSNDSSDDNTILDSNDFDSQDQESGKVDEFIAEKSDIEDDSDEEKMHKNLESAINDIYSKFGLPQIDKIDFDETNEDSIEIAPMYLEETIENGYEEASSNPNLGESPYELEGNDDASEEASSESDKLEELDDKEIINNSQEVVSKMIDNQETNETPSEDLNSENKNSKDESVFIMAESVVVISNSQDPEDALANTTKVLDEQEELELEEEIELFESEGGLVPDAVVSGIDTKIDENSPEDVSNDEENTKSVVSNDEENTTQDDAEEIKSLTFPELVVFLENLHKKSEKLDREISEIQDEQKTLDSEIKSVREDYEGIVALAKAIDEECNRLSEEYKRKCDELEEIHKTLDEKELTFNKKNEEMTNHQEKEKKLKEEKETILDNVEEATSRFRVR